MFLSGGVVSTFSCCFRSRCCCCACGSFWHGGGGGCLFLVTDPATVMAVAAVVIVVVIIADAEVDTAACDRSVGGGVGAGRVLIDRRRRFNVPQPGEQLLARPPPPPLPGLDSEMLPVVVVHVVGVEHEAFWLADVVAVEMPTDIDMFEEAGDVGLGGIGAGPFFRRRGENAELPSENVDDGDLVTSMSAMVVIKCPELFDVLLVEPDS